MSSPARGRPTNPRTRKLLTVDVTAKQLELLRKFDYPLSQELVGSARPTGEGFRLRGIRFGRAEGPVGESSRENTSEGLVPLALLRQAF